MSHLYLAKESTNFRGRLNIFQNRCKCLKNQKDKFIKTKKKQKKKHSVQNVKFNIPNRAVGVYHNNRSTSVMYVPQVLVSTNVLQHKFFFEST